MIARQREVEPERSHVTRVFTRNPWMGAELSPPTGESHAMPTQSTLELVCRRLDGRGGRERGKRPLPSTTKAAERHSGS